MSSEINFANNFLICVCTDEKIIEKQLSLDVRLASNVQRIFYLPEVSILFMLRTSIISGQGD